MVSQFMQDPKEIHWKDTKRIVHYIKGTCQLGINITLIQHTHWLDIQTWIGQGTIMT